MSQSYVNDPTQGFVVLEVSPARPSLIESLETRWMDLWLNEGWHLLLEMRDAYPDERELRLKAASLIRMAREIVDRADRTSDLLSEHPREFVPPVEVEDCK